MYNRTSCGTVALMVLMMYFFGRCGPIKKHLTDHTSYGSATISEQVCWTLRLRCANATHQTLYFCHFWSKRKSYDTMTNLSIARTCSLQLSFLRHFLWHYSRLFCTKLHMYYYWLRKHNVTWSVSDSDTLHGNICLIYHNVSPKIFIGKQIIWIQLVL